MTSQYAGSEKTGGENVRNFLVLFFLPNRGASDIYIYRWNAAFFSSYVGFTLTSERHRLVSLFIVLLLLLFFPFFFPSPCLKMFCNFTAHG